VSTYQPAVVPTYQPATSVYQPASSAYQAPTSDYQPTSSPYSAGQPSQAYQNYQPASSYLGQNAYGGYGAPKPAGQVAARGKVFSHCHELTSLGMYTKCVCIAAGTVEFESDDRDSIFVCHHCSHLRLFRWSQVHYY